MLYDKAMITNAAREGARAGIMLREPRLSMAKVEEIATDYCRDRLITLGNSTCAAIAKVEPPAPIESLESNLSVEVSYQYQGPISSLVALISGKPLNLEPMTSKVAMKYE